MSGTFKHPFLKIKLPVSLELSHSGETSVQIPEGVQYEQGWETAPTALHFLQENHPKEIQDVE